MELLKRKVDKYLNGWKDSPSRKPLIVKGARQIGKTESIRAFGNANYQSVIEINFVLQKKFRAIFDEGHNGLLGVSIIPYVATTMETPDAIEDVPATYSLSTSASAAIYNLQGQRLSTPQRGVNIVGKTKIIVK